MSSLESPQVVNALAKIAGANSLEIVDELADESEMDEFSLAERLGMDVKTVRKILYRLYDNRLVKFRRIKDKETGWYIYLWKFHEDKLEVLMDRFQREETKKLRERLDYEENHQFFLCDNGCARMPFQNAMEGGFVCPHCGSKLNFVDNSNIIRNLEQQLKQIERSVGS